MNLGERPVSNMKRIGGRLCLDFVNTIGGRRYDVASSGKTPRTYSIRDDKINDYFDLLAWAMRVEFLSENEARALAGQAQKNRAEATAVCKRAIQLREALYRISSSILSNSIAQESDLKILNRELQVAFDRMSLAKSRGNFRWEWTDTKGSLERILCPIADSAAEMLTTADLADLRQCKGEDCGWLFEDTSRNHSRKWATCGIAAMSRRSGDSGPTYANGNRDSNVKL